MNAQYENALANAVEMMAAEEDLEPTSALKQAAADVGIARGDDMGRFVKWAHQRLVASAGSSDLDLM